MFQQDREALMARLGKAEHLLSIPALHSIEENRRFYLSRLSFLITIPADYDKNASNISLLGLVIASGLYPNVAMWKGHRNAFRLRQMRAVSAAPSSIFSQVGTMSVREARGSPPVPRRPLLASSQSLGSTSTLCNTEGSFPALDKALLAQWEALDKQGLPLTDQSFYYVYSALSVAPTPSLSQMTAIDPLILPLFADKCTIQQEESNGETNHVLTVDDWLHIKSDPSSLEMLRLLKQMKLKWSSFLSASIANLLRLNQDQEILEQTEKGISTILALVKETVPIRRRHVEFKNLIWRRPLIQNVRRLMKSQTI